MTSEENNKPQSLPYQIDELPDNWDLPEDTGVAFPEGRYVAILGRFHPKVEPQIGLISSVMQDVWMAKFIGSPTSPANEGRIAIDKDGKVTLRERGVKHLEFFPSPKLQENMAWKAKAFYSNFNCLQETPPNEDNKRIKQINWTTVAMQYGRVFICDIVYKEYKGKTYRNMKYDTIELDDVRVVPPEHMVAIEEEYARMHDESNGGVAGYTAPSTNLDDVDIPF